MGKYAQLVIGPAGCGKVRLAAYLNNVSGMYSLVGRVLHGAWATMLHVTAAGNAAPSRSKQKLGFWGFSDWAEAWLLSCAVAGTWHGWPVATAHAVTSAAM